MGHVINALAYPAVVALLARPFGFAGGYAAFVVVTNWASLFVNMGLSLASPLMLLGAVGKALFAPVWMLLFVASVFLIWRASRQTLAADAWNSACIRSSSSWQTTRGLAGTRSRTSRSCARAARCADKR